MINSALVFLFTFRYNYLTLGVKAKATHNLVGLYCVIRLGFALYHKLIMRIFAKN